MKKFASSLLIAVILVMCLSASALAANYVHFTGSCHVRDGAGSWYDSIGIVNKNSTLSYNGSTKYVDGIAWYSVIYSGKSGWVSSKYAYLSSKGGSSTYGAGGSGGSYAGGKTGSFVSGSKVHIKGQCNIRSGPSLSHGIIGVAHNGDVLTGTGSISTDTRGVDWYSVSYNGKNGWVSSAYASIGSKGGGSKGGSSKTKVRGTSGNSNVRSGPALDYPSLGILYQGESATYLGNSSVDSRGVIWYNIAWNGGSGWVSSKFTKLQ